MEALRRVRESEVARGAVGPAPLVVDLFGRVSFSDGEWARLEPLVAELDRQSDAASNTRRWAPDFNWRGQVGEWVYSKVSGQPWSPEARLEQVRRDGGFRDGGIDFPPGIDVKATVHRDGWLLRPVRDGLPAPFYGLVSIDLSGRCGWYRGYQTREVFAAARRRDDLRVENYWLEQSELVRALPPA